MRWLHISDTHFGYQSASSDKMREKLLEKAGEIAPVDCLFITGDLRYGKTEQRDYPTETLTFIRQLQEALGIGPEDTFVVPGNHDVNRNQVLESCVKRAAGEYRTSNGTIPPETLEYIQNQRQPFRSLYKEICGREEPGWHYCIQKDGLNIICLNTALFSCGDDEDGTLIVGSGLLNQLSKTVDSRVPGIVLAHHDFDSLRQEEQRELELTLKDMGAVLYLCGHKHVALGRVQNSFRTNQPLYVFLCGTSMDKDPTLEQTDMDVFVGEIDKDKKSGWVQAFKWHYSCHDWLQDQVFSHHGDKTQDGIRYFPREARPPEDKLPKPVNRDVLERYRRFLRIQCGEIELNGLPTNQEDAGRKYALERIFVPLSFQRFEGRDEEDGEIPEGYEEADEAPVSPEKAKITLEELIPESGCFRHFILSDPGGGKTTLLKRIASVYSLRDDGGDDGGEFPRRELFPVWIRCRDIPVGSRACLWDVIENVARLGEWMPGDTAAEDFTRLVASHIENGTALLLIDGLDEIGSDTDRQHFVEQLRVFAESNPLASMIVTSRITGFRAVTAGKFSDFSRFEISPLKKEGVEDLCVKWYRIVHGEGGESEEKARTLSDKITGDMRIFRLARNPLMLTTLLLVERRVGKLPNRRTALYDEAIQVLLETWNQAGHEHEKVDQEEAKYQLSYVAFHMMIHHTKRIAKRELTRLLREFRRDFSDLVSNGEPVSAFISKIEKRSALLIQKGYEEADNGVLEAVYEFQHLTFQEYLAAYAAVSCSYPGAADEYDYGAALRLCLLDTTLKETISLAAILDRRCARELAGEILEKMESEEMPGDQQMHLRTLLLQFAADEVQWKDELAEKIIAACFKDGIWRSDIELIRQILSGRYGKMVKEYALQADRLHNAGYANMKSVFLLLAGEIADPWQYYMDHRLSSCDKERVEAIVTLAVALWIDEKALLEKLDDARCQGLAQELFAFLEEGNWAVQKGVFRALQHGKFLAAAEPLARYIRACVRCINTFRKVPPLWNGLLLLKTAAKLPADIGVRLDAEVIREICARGQSVKLVFSNNYENLLVLALIAVITGVDRDSLREMFSFIRKKRRETLGWKDSMSDRFYNFDCQLARTVQQLALLNQTYPAPEKNAIQEHILRLELAAVRELKRRAEAVEERCSFFYDDFSLSDGSRFRLSSMENSADDLIAYITGRLEAIGCPPEDEDGTTKTKEEEDGA